MKIPFPLSFVSCISTQGKERISFPLLIESVPKKILNGQEIFDMQLSIFYSFSATFELESAQRVEARRGGNHDCT